MSKSKCGPPLPLPAEVTEAYHNSLLALNEATVSYVIGGAYALAHHTGVIRHTKDFDIFLRPADRDKALAALSKAGYRTEVVFPYWLAKAYVGDHMIDLIYRAPNGVVDVTESWFDRGVPCQVLETAALVCAPEEILITKLFVMNNDRNDSADVMHLLLSCADRLDWDHLLAQLGSYWRVLLGHIVFFGFVYPSERNRVPETVLRGLLRRCELEDAANRDSSRVCNGPLFSHSQYKIDVAERGFHDGRLRPFGRMTPNELIDATISTDDPNRPSILRAAANAPSGGTD